MVTLKEEVIIKEEKYFVCIFLDNEGKCLVKKKKCSQEKEDEKCRQVEDMLQ